MCFSWWNLPKWSHHHRCPLQQDPQTACFWPILWIFSVYFSLIQFYFPEFDPTSISWFQQKSYSKPKCIPTISSTTQPKDSTDSPDNPSLPVQIGTSSTNAQFSLDDFPQVPSSFLLLEHHYPHKLQYIVSD